MSGTLIACLAVGIAISIVVIFMLAGALVPNAAASTWGQMALSAVSTLVGLGLGQFIHRRFFAVS